MNDLERRLLRSVCQALLPPGQSGAGDDAALFVIDDNALGLVAAIEQALNMQDPVQQRRFRLFLRMLDHRLVNWLLIGRACRLEALSQSEKEKLLRALATSRWGFLRRWFQAIKRLAMFYGYCLPDASGRNPCWVALGYTPPAKTPGSPPSLTVQTIKQSEVLECDACVIGSGAGGSVVAAELAQAGRNVIVLEAGSGQQAQDYEQNEAAGVNQLYLDHGLTTTDDLGVTILAGATVGGGTAVNWQTCLPLPPAIRDEWTEVSDCKHFSEDSFTRSLEAVSQRLAINTTESVINRNNAKLREGCEALGLAWRLLPRNAQHCDPSQCGFCVFGCRHGGKQSTSVTFLRDAQRAANTRILVHCRAERVIIHNGRAIGVSAVASDPLDGSRYEVQVRAPLVVAAAGALHSPALLLRSGLVLPALGRHLSLHPTTPLAGIYDERIEPWNGPPQSILCEHFAYQAGNYGFRLETAPVHPGAMAQAAPWLSARQHLRLMQWAGHMSAIIVLVRDRGTGYVRLGHRGRPVIQYQPGPQELAYLKQGMMMAARVHLAAGASGVLTMHALRLQLSRRSRSPQAPQTIDKWCERIERCPLDRNWCMLYSAHQMGTCRMGRSRRTAVCDADGQVFGVRGLFIADASAFPASSGVNPMLSIMALAHHTAQRIKALS